MKWQSPSFSFQRRRRTFWRFQLSSISRFLHGNNPLPDRAARGTLRLDALMCLVLQPLSSCRLPRPSAAACARRTATGHTAPAAMLPPHPSTARE
eukprot:5760485-Prymnesium_polylepis.1